MKTNFQDKTVVITGASSGFGAACAHLYAREGARLINLARRAERLAELETELAAKYSTPILSLAVDVSDLEAVNRAFQNIPEPFASPDILINNAGMVRGLNKVWETSAEDWNDMIDINIKGILNICSQVIPRMLKKNAGHIVNVSSISGHETYPGGGVYCATKHAVKAITDTLRKELVATPLRVSMISPGMAKTEFSLVRFNGNAKQADQVYNGIEALTADDIAEIILFMTSRPSHVNIADLIVFPTHQASVSIVHRS